MGGFFFVYIRINIYQITFEYVILFLYNDLLKYWKLKQYPPIANGTKIKWVYLKENPLNIPQIGFRGYDDPKEIMDFINQYVDHDKLFERALQKKLKMFYDSLDWSEPVDSANTLERFF